MVPRAQVPLHHGLEFPSGRSGEGWDALRQVWTTCRCRPPALAWTDAPQATVNRWNMVKPLKRCVIWLILSYKSYNISAQLNQPTFNKYGFNMLRPCVYVQLMWWCNRLQYSCFVSQPFVTTRFIHMSCFPPNGYCTMLTTNQTSSKRRTHYFCVHSKKTCVKGSVGWTPERN